MATTFKTRVVNAGDSYDGQCACGFASNGWAVKKHAQARIAEHAAEHESGEPMRELRDFEVELGLHPAIEVGFDDSAEG